MITLKFSSLASRQGFDNGLILGYRDDDLLVNLVKKFMVPMIDHRVNLVVRSSGGNPIFCDDNTVEFLAESLTVTVSLLDIERTKFNNDKAEALAEYLWRDEFGRFGEWSTITSRDKWRDKAVRLMEFINEQGTETSPSETTG